MLFFEYHPTAMISRSFAAAATVVVATAAAASVCGAEAETAHGAAD